MPLTDIMLRNLKSYGTPAKLADSEGLYLYLSASGGKLWRMDYRYAGKRKTLSFGAYPAVSLKDARRKRDSMGRYSRDGRMMPNRIYSRDGGKDRMMEHLDAMMDEASTDKEREAIRRFMAQIEKA